MSTTSEVDLPELVDSDRIDCDDLPEHPDQGAESSEEKTAELALAPKANIPLLIIASIAVIFAIYFARAVIMPLVMSAILALLFRPSVRYLRRFRMPDYVGAGVLMLGLLMVFGIGGYYLSGPAQGWMESAPENLRTAGQKLRVVTEQIDKISETSEKMSEIASGSAEPEGDPFPFAPEPADAANSTETNEQSGGVATADGISPTPNRSRAAVAVEPVSSANADLATKSNKSVPVPVEIRQPKIQTGITLFSTTGNFLSLIFIVLVLAYFFLAWGDMLINNILHTLSTFREKRCTVELIHSVEEGISKYLITVTCINLGLGVAVGTAMWLFGVPNPVLWGVMAMLFNFVPYIGALVGIGVVCVVALLSFDSFSYALCVPLTYFALTTIEGNFITPYLLGRSMSLNPILIILSLIFWSWMWGIGGAILAVPLLAILKIAFDHFEKTKSLGILLSGSD